MRLTRSFVLAPVVVLGLACGSPARPPEGSQALPPGATMTCPPPIGTVPKEDCAAIATDFGSLTVQGALPLAGSGKYAEQRLEAIRAVGELAQSIKDQRVKLCERYVKCTVPVAEHDAQDHALTAAMGSLVELWNKRRFSGLDEVVRFRQAVRAVALRVNGGAEPAAAPVQPPRVFKAEEALGRVEDPGVAFQAGSGAVTVTTSAEGKREALISKPEVVALSAGHRYRVKIGGTYRPAAPPLVVPGDELLARMRYRAEGDATIHVALRSIEDPEAAESAETIRATAGEKTRDIKLVADLQQTGFYLGVGIKGAPVEIAELDLLRGGKVLATARAGEPGTRTECQAGKPGAAGKSAALRCQPGEGDRIMLAQPEGYLMMGIRDATGQRALLRTLSLEGGRSLDAAVGDDARIFVTMVGAGAATLERIEVTELPP